MLEFIKTELGCLNFESSCKCFKKEKKKAFFHKVRININKILILILFVPCLSSLICLRTARIFSTRNKEKKLESLLGKAAIFKARH